MSAVLGCGVPWARSIFHVSCFSIHPGRLFHCFFGLGCSSAVAVKLVVFLCIESSGVLTAVVGGATGLGLNFGLWPEPPGVELTNIVWWLQLF
mmetsp:Transcript_19523/g.43426  ORF Transcript_19523/g.43426 Transcript_19523/m.43426 type:complete len:93 (+) Transcript_19523:333-611(+)